MQTPERPPVFMAWDLLALLGFGGLLAFWLRVAPSLPDPVPSHYDTLGRVNAWTPKASLPWMVFGLPLLVWLVLFAIGVGMSMAQEDPAKAKVSALGPVRGCLGLGLGLLMAGFLAIPSMGLFALKAAAGGFVALVVLGIVATIVQTTALLASAPDADHYRWGTFYVNPLDPRLWVEKRIGVGWTLNYARPAAFWITALILLPALLVPLGILLATR